MIVAACLAVSYAFLPWVVSRLFDDAQAARPVVVEVPARDATSGVRSSLETLICASSSPCSAPMRTSFPTSRDERASVRVTDFGKERSDGAARLSEDIQNHYPEYSVARERLRKTVVEQEEGTAGHAARDDESAASSGRGAGDGSRSPGPGEVLRQGPWNDPDARRDGRRARAFEVFASFSPTEVTALCQSLKRRAAGISSSARKLSTEARALSERTTLPGECKFTRPEPASGG